MNHRMIARILSRVSLTEAAMLGVCAAVAALYRETVLVPFGVPILILLALFGLLSLVQPRTRDIYAREGFVVVALSWLLMSLFGCLPFHLSGMGFTDAFFETVSGFTTTGATVVQDVEALPHGLLFWRSLTHWIGGMGVLVFLMAIMPLAGNRSMHLLRAEAPGPSVGKLVPRAQSTAILLYGIYCFLSVLQLVLLLLCGMPLFDSVTTVFATAGTGGFAIKNASIAFYQNPAAEIVVTVFMLLFGVNFNLYFLMLVKRPLNALKSEELRWYLAIFLLTTAAMTASILPEIENIGTAIRLAAFQNASIMSTTGFATADFARWPEFAQSTLVMLMAIGSCAGSTGGGLKVSRVMILLKSCRREILHMLHPRSVGLVKLEGRSVDQDTVHGVLAYFAIYCLILCGSVLLIALNRFDHATTVTSVMATLNNVGPGLAGVGPVETYAKFSAFSKYVLCADMLIGRLEIFPMLLLFAPSVWRKRG